MTRARFGSGTVAVTFRSGRAVELAPEDFWDLYSPRGCKIDPPGELDPDNVVTLRKDDIEVRVVASPQLQFWYAWQLGFWERETFNVIDKFVTKGHTFIDVGAWIGPTVLYGVHRAARAFAFEPDPVAFPELEANAKANGIEALELIN